MESYCYRPHKVLRGAGRDRGLYTAALLWVMVICYYCVICAFSGQPATESTKESDVIVERVVKVVTAVKKSGAKNHDIFHDIEFVVRKLAHFLNFYILGFLCIMLASALCGDMFSAKAAAAALLCGLFGAALDEWHQLYVPGRSAEVRDVCVDFAGVSIGCLTFAAAAYFAARERRGKSE